MTDQFTTIMITIVLTSIIVISLFSMLNAKKDYNNTPFNLNELLNNFGLITNRLYSVYEAFGKIDRKYYDTDKEYREKVIDIAINTITDTLKENHIDISIDKSTLHTIACLAVEKVIDMTELRDKNQTIIDTNKKIVDSNTTDLGEFTN